MLVLLMESQRFAVTSNAGMDKHFARKPRSTLALQRLYPISFRNTGLDGPTVPIPAGEVFIVIYFVCFSINITAH